MSEETTQQTSRIEDYDVEYISTLALRPHPRNYRKHPADQIAHLVKSIQEHGFYRNIVIARDNTILAGHGVVQAAQQMGLETVPVIRLGIEPDSPQALKILTGDNEIGRLGEVDDRALTEILKEIKQVDIHALLGTGYDGMMLANLAFVTRPKHEVKDIDEAAHWVGMPAYEPSPHIFKLTVSFRTMEDRHEFDRHLGLLATDKPKWSIWYPPESEQDIPVRQSNMLIYEA